MYQINVYALESLEHTYMADDARTAILTAYRRIGDNGRTAHIIKTGTQSGLFICRSDDLDRMRLPDLIERLKDVQWDRPIL